MIYVLIAQNISGAYLKYIGNTIKEAIANFDNAYSRKGFKIIVEENFSKKIRRTLKKTYR